MPITKVGSELIKEADVLWNAAKGTTKFLYRRAKNIGKAGKGFVWAAGKGVAGAGKLGAFAAKHPTVGIPIVATGLAAGLGFSKKFNKYYTHTDTDSDVTRYGPLGISYKDPRMAKVINKQNFYY